MTCATCGAIVDAVTPTCQLCGTPVPRAEGTGTVGQNPAVAAQLAAGATGATGAADRPAAQLGSGAPGSGDSPGAGHGAGYGAGSGAGSGYGAGQGDGGTPPPPPAAAGAGWGPAEPHPSGLSAELRGWGIAAHLGGLVVGVASAAVFGFVGPLLVWLFKRDEHPFIDHHAKESLNFQLTVLLVIVISAVLAIPAVIFGVLTLGIGLILLAALAVVAMVAWIVLPIIGAVKASNGEGYRYPFTIRFIS